MSMWLVLVAPFAFPKPPDYSLLSRRVQNLDSGEDLVKCLRLDTMVPRQRLEFQFGPPISHALREASRGETRLVVVGMDYRQDCLLRHGVEVRIESMSPYRASQGFFSSHSTTPMRGFTALDTTLVGGRRCEIVEADELPEWPPADPVFEARVRWLPDEQGTAAASLLARQLDPLIDEWIGLVQSTHRERQDGQLRKTLLDLGPRPDPDEAPDDLAFWVTALINPLPALGVAREIRPFVLQVVDSSLRVQAAQRALTDSIERLKRLPPGPIEVEPPPPGYERR